MGNMDLIILATSGRGIYALFRWLQWAHSDVYPPTLVAMPRKPQHRLNPNSVKWVICAAVGEPVLLCVICVVFRQHDGVCIRNPAPGPE